MPLIGSIVCTPPSPHQGESVLVQVLAPDGSSYAEAPDAVVVINGITGAEQYLQFEHAGQHQLLVTVARAEETELLTQALDIQPVPSLDGAPEVITPDRQAMHVLSLRPEVGLPMLRIARSPHQPYEVGFSVGRRHSYGEGLVTGPAAGQSRITLNRELTAQVFAQNAATGGPSELAAALETIATPAQPPDIPTYHWDFGDGTSVTTTDMYVQHDFEAALDADTEHRTFHVRAKVEQPGQDPVEVVRTVSVFSGYVTCKRLGTLVPKVRSSGFARRAFQGLEASFTVEQHRGFPAGPDQPPGGGHGR